MTNRRNAAIDLLRGLSIVLVIVHHVAIRIPLRKTALVDFVPVRLLNALAYNGYEAVFIFFVISGFLIATNAMERWGSLGAIDVRAFYARRAARILPCLLALISVLCVMHFAQVDQFTIRREDQSLPRAVLAALGLHLNWYEGRTSWLPGAWDVLWSLSIEEVFYLGFPLLCLGLARTRFFAPALFVLAASLPFTRAALAGNEIWQEKAYLPGMAGIAAGVLGALVAARWMPRAAWVARALGVAGAVGIAAVLVFGDVLWKGLGLGNGTMLVLTGSSTAFVIAAHWRARAGGNREVPGTAWLRSFGRLSYECYLTHMFVVFPVVRAYRATGAVLAHGYLWYLPAVALSWALGAAVGRWFSTPSERALRARWSSTGSHLAAQPGA